MLMNITDITLPMMTQIPTCNVTGCRANIADYASKGWRFETEKFHQCNHCPHMAYIEPPLSISPDWLKMWSVENFFIKNSMGQDRVKNPMMGDMTICILECFFDITCVAFSRQKTIGNDDKNGECWLKTNITVNQIPDDPEWHTIVFNPPS
jgi:hypothetical protein